MIIDLLHLYCMDQLLDQKNQLLKRRKVNHSIVNNCFGVPPPEMAILKSSFSVAFAETKSANNSATPRDALSALSKM